MQDAEPMTSNAHGPNRAERPSEPVLSSRGESVTFARRPCPHCNLWENGPGDIYCGFCGRLLLDLRIRPERPVLISGISGSAAQREIVITNGGSRALQANLVPMGRTLPGLIVEPATAFDILAGDVACVLLRLDEEQLPRDLVVEELSYAVMIDNDPHQTVEVPITVRAGPRPVLSTPILHFGDLAEGSQAVRQLELRNLGGIPLRVREIRVEGSPQLALVDKPFPMVIGIGERLALPVEWDTRRSGKAAEPTTTGLRLSFDNYGNTLFVAATARLFRFSLAFDREAIRIPTALAKQDYIQNVTVTNTGTIDVDISGVESDQPWIEVVVKERSFTLRCAASMATSSPVATAAGESALFTVVCHPQRLEEGRHVGKVTVVPVGQARQTLAVDIHVLRPQPSKDYLGIDFGTSNSVIAFYNERSNAPDVVEVVDATGARSPLIPSVLAFIGGPDTYKIGDEALSEFQSFPDRGIRSIKRIMGYQIKREFFGRSFSPEELASRIIEKLVQLAEEQYFQVSGKYLSFEKAIVTVPANFFDSQIRGILEACRLAGIDTEEEAARQAALKVRAALGREVNAGIILDEPSAAALFYLDHLEAQGRLPGLSGRLGKDGGINLLVFDYGGGTLDVSVANVERMEKGGAGLKVLANLGNNRIGGDSLDVILMQELLRRCKGEFKEFDESLIVSNRGELEARSRAEGWNTSAKREVHAVRGVWKNTAEKAKIELSHQEESRVEMLSAFILRGLGGKATGSVEERVTSAASRPFSTLVKRADFERLIEGILMQCEDLVRSALSLAELAPEEIDFVIHTGRQSQMPAVRRRVKALFPALPVDNDVLEEKHLKVCVAKGAALYGLMKGGFVAEGAGVQLLNEGRRLPHSYGMEKTVGLLQREFDEIVQRGRTYPLIEPRHLSESMIPSSGQLSLKFYQNIGTRKQMKGNPEISLIGQITVDTLADGKPGAEIQFMIDANRKLEVLVDGRQVEIEPVRLQDEETWMV